MPGWLNPSTVSGRPCPPCSELVGWSQRSFEGLRGPSVAVPPVAHAGCSVRSPPPSVQLQLPPNVTRGVVSHAARLTLDIINKAYLCAHFLQRLRSLVSLLGCPVSPAQVDN